MYNFIDKFFLSVEKIIDKLIKNEKLNKLFKKLFSKEMVLYLVCGVLATVVNFVAFWLLCKAFENNNLFGNYDVLITNILAWLISVTFAFFTNKLLVFESRSFKANIVRKEMLTFFSARLVTLGVEEAGLLVFTTWLHFNEMIVKLFVAIVVIVLNYIFSKVIIFKKKT